MGEQATLKRSLTLPMVVLYGLGTTVGAGIYALTGEIAGRAGMHAPLAFLIASALAAFTALSFAELSSRFPRSAGEAVYVTEAFGRPRIGALIGLMVMLAGSVSAATVSNAVPGYLAEFAQVPREMTLIVFCLVLGVIAAWGITESATVAALITLVEVAVLVLVAWAARGALADLPARATEILVPGTLAWPGLLGASLLAFYAFIGFEDMVNVAEEVKNVRVALPRAIVLTLVATTLLYMMLTTVAVLALPPQELSQSEAPLTYLYERVSNGRASPLISGVSIVAMVNGALIQIIMASRVLYGLAMQGMLPRVLASIHPRRRTPVTATGAVTAFVAALAVWFPLAPLAAATSTLTLLVFAVVNLALMRIKARPMLEECAFVLPRWVPWTGFAVSLAFLVVGLGGFVES